MRNDLIGNPLGGLVSDIDVSVAVAADEATSRRIATLLAHEGLTVAARASGPRRLPDACQNRPPHVAVGAWKAWGPEPGAAVRHGRRALSRSRVGVVSGDSRRQDRRGAGDAGAGAGGLECA